MPGTTSPDNIAFPLTTERVNPLRSWFVLLANSVQTAIANLRTELAVAPLPNPISSRGTDVSAVSAGAWTDLPGFTAIKLTLPAAAWCAIDVGAWVVATAGDTRVSARVTGATVLGESQVDVGGSTAAWGQVMYAAAAAAVRQQTSHRYVRLNAGENTIQVRAYKNGGGVHQANYATLQVTPIRWA